MSSTLNWSYHVCCSILLVLCPDEATRDHLTYAKLVLHLAQKHGGQGWLVYDDKFCA